MAGKGPAIASRGVFYALEGLSKNTLIDLVADIAQGEVGIEIESSAEILAWIQKRLEPVHRARRQKSVDLVGELSKLAAMDSRRQSVTHAAASESEKALAAQASSGMEHKPVWEA